jgi:hypothetical protein
MLRPASSLSGLNNLDASAEQERPFMLSSSRHPSAQGWPYLLSNAGLCIRLWSVCLVYKHDKVIHFSYRTGDHFLDNHREEMDSIARRTLLVEKRVKVVIPQTHQHHRPLDTADGCPAAPSLGADPPSVRSRTSTVRTCRARKSPALRDSQHRNTRRETEFQWLLECR